MRFDRNTHRPHLTHPAGLLALSACLAALTACGHRSDLEAIPQELQGYWATDDTRYVNRAFRLDGERVVFFTGGGTFTVQRLVSIDTANQGDETLFELRYRSPNADLYYFDFLFQDAPEPTIRFKNQPSITWRKTGEPPL